MTQQQFLKFLVIGVFSTLVNYGTFYVVYQILSMHYIISSAVGFLIGVLAGYHFNKQWTFGVKSKDDRYILKYYGVYTTSLFLGLILLKILVDGLQLNPVFGNMVSICLTTCTNFIGTKFFVFKG